MKIKTGELIELLDFLVKINMTNLQTAELAALLTAMCAMRKVHSEWTELLKDANDKCRPKEWTPLMERVRVSEGLKAEERKDVDMELEALDEKERNAVLDAVAAYNKRVREVVTPMLEKVHEIELPGFTAESVARLAESNPGWQLGQAMAIQETLLSE